MGEQHIYIMQLFNAPVDAIFDILTDHESFGQVINAKIRRVIDSQGDNKNGVGSIIKNAIDKSIRRGIKRLAERYEN